MNNSVERFHVLDAWRGIAAISVALFHLHVADSLTEWSIIREAWLFVPLFFVLSGFVLMHSYGRKENFDGKDMLIKRFFRIWPLHLSLLSVFVMFEVGKLFAQQKGIQFTFPAFTAQNSLSEIVPNMFLIQSWANSFKDLSFNYPAWSISVEVGMYVILAVVLSITSNQKIRLYLFSSIVIFVTGVLLIGIDKQRTLAQVGMLGFSLGVCLQYFYSRRVSAIKSFKNRMTTTQLTLLEIGAVSLILILMALPLPTAQKYVVASFGFMLVILIFSMEGGLISSALKKKLFQKLGEISYSIYMVHAAIIFTATAACQALGVGTVMRETVNAGSDITLRFFDGGSYWINQALLIMFLVCVISISLITYKIIGIRGQHLKNKLIPRK